MRRCIASLALLAACHRAPALPVVFDLDADGAVGDAKAGVAASIAWWSLPAPTRAGLAAAIERLGDRARLRTQPGWVELDENDEALLRPIAQQLLPVFTAADALAPGRWLVDGRAVAAVRGCPPGHRCVAPVRADARVQFAGWPLARALVVPATVVDRLREALITPGTRIGLVVVVEPVNASEIERVRTAVARLDGATLSPSLARLIDGLGELDTTRVPPWLPLPRERALVVPRLAAAVAPREFEREVCQRIGQR